MIELTETYPDAWKTYRDARHYGIAGLLDELFHEYSAGIRRTRLVFVVIIRPRCLAPRYSLGVPGKYSPLEHLILIHQHIHKVPRGFKLLNDACGRLKLLINTPAGHVVETFYIGHAGNVLGVAQS